MFLEFLLRVGPWTVLAILAGICIYLLGPRHRPVFPIVNNTRATSSAEGGIARSRNAHKLISEGLAKHQGPITATISHGRKIVLPSSLAGWVKSHKDLDDKQLVREEFCASIPGFEALSVLHDPDEMLVRVIKTKMGQNDSTWPR
jgi:hypothetical protein